MLTELEDSCPAERAQVEAFKLDVNVQELDDFTDRIFLKVARCIIVIFLSTLPPARNQNDTRNTEANRRVSPEAGCCEGGFCGCTDGSLLPCAANQEEHKLRDFYAWGSGFCMGMLVDLAFLELPSCIGMLGDLALLRQQQVSVFSCKSKHIKKIISPWHDIRPNDG